MYFKELLDNRILWVVFAAWMFSCILKGILVCIKEKKLDMTRFLGSGGMPSSHSTLVTSLAISMGISVGFDSPEFVICGALAFVVMYDASGVRRETGRQAEILNDIIENFGKDAPEMFGKRLKELIGHSPVEVTVGAILGVIIGLLMYLPV